MATRRTSNTSGGLRHTTTKNTNGVTTNTTSFKVGSARIATTTASNGAMKRVVTQPVAGVYYDRKTTVYKSPTKPKTIKLKHTKPKTIKPVVVKRNKPPKAINAQIRRGVKSNPAGPDPAAQVILLIVMLPFVVFFYLAKLAYRILFGKKTSLPDADV